MPRNPEKPAAILVTRSDLQRRRACGPFLALGTRRKTFPAGSNSYRVQSSQPLFFQGLTDGTVCALGKGRRSGAQRGAPENNFGQRFSWAPLANSALPPKSFVLSFPHLFTFCC